MSPWLPGLRVPCVFTYLRVFVRSRHILLKEAHKIVPSHASQKDCKILTSVCLSGLRSTVRTSCREEQGRGGRGGLASSHTRGVSREGVIGAQAVERGHRGGFPGGRAVPPAACPLRGARLSGEGGAAHLPDVEVGVVFLAVQHSQQGGVFIVSEIECTVIYS